MDYDKAVVIFKALDADPKRTLALLSYERRDKRDYSVRVYDAQLEDAAHLLEIAKLAEEQDVDLRLDLENDSFFLETA